MIKFRYRILEPLGRGGVAAVYRALDETLDRDVAVKILDERYSRDAAFIERFRREAQAAAGIHHPNVVTIFDTGEEDGSHYIIMEFVAGSTLKDLLSGGPLPVDRAVRLGMQIATALGHAHRAGIIHRDVKSKNIMITPDGIVKIADFGIARALDQPGITQTGKVLGTAEYLSPEQAVGMVATERSDIYSFGVVLYEALTGKPPFTGENPIDVASKQVSEIPAKVSEKNQSVPEKISNFVGSLLAKNPDDRPESFDEVLQSLRSWLDNEETTLPIPVIVPEPGAGRRRSNFLKISLTAFTIIAIAMVFFISLNKPLRRADVVESSSSSALSPVKPLELVDYDPEGDKSEHPDQVGLALDGRADTAWVTAGYANDRFGDLKSGVGIYGDFGREQSIKQIRVRSDARGWSAQIKASNDGLSWKVLTKKIDLPDDYTFNVKGSNRYYLLWITKLTVVPERDNFRVAVNEIEFLH